MTLPTHFKWLGFVGFCLVSVASHAVAGQVEIVRTEFVLRGGAWTVSTTLRHGDTGWEHYADAWRVVNEKGDVLGTRTLFHPHVDEQPFTRSQSGIQIAKDTHIVFVEAHDKKHGWSPQRIQVDLRQSEGERFTVQR